jgi:site-specific DNA-methyltransferase (adenine-specific)
MHAAISRVTLANLEAGRGSLSSLIAALKVLGHRFADQMPEVELGRSIARARKRAGLSQERLCALARVSKPALVRVERGEGNVATLVAAMDELGLSRSLVAVAIESAPPPLPDPTGQVLLGDCREHMRGFAQQGLMFDAIVTDPPYHLSSISRRFGRKKAAPLTGGEPGSANPYRTLASRFMRQTWDGGDIAFDVDTWRAVHAVLKPGGHLVAFGGTRTFHRLAVAIEDAGFEIRDQIMWLFGSGFPKSHNLKGEHKGQGTALKPAYEPILIARKPIRESSVAANVLRFRTGSINIDACRVPTDELIEMGRAGRKRGSSVALEGVGLPATLGGTVTHAKGRWPANVIHDGIDESWSRYFYSAKASKSDRGSGNNHPTVKPNDLMRYLVRLVTPPGGTVFDPFMGSGSTGVAAIQEGFSFAGSEQQAEYVEIARGRIAKVMPKHGSVLSELQPEETPAIRNAS